MAIAMLIAGLAAGAALASLLLARAKQRERAELQALTERALAQTGDALAARIQESRRLDEERANGEMALRTEEIRGLVGPVQQRLERMQEEIARLERERREGQGQLSAMVAALGKGVGDLREETGRLVTALRRPATRGAWGELQLRNVVEMAGMVDHCDFVEQRSLTGEEGVLRPDMLVRLPGGKTVVVDSKVPLDAYLSALEAADDGERDVHTARHARQTREHIAKLAAKSYQSQLDSSPEFVVMFLPSDAIYQAALAKDPELIEYGVGHRVLMATPTTLIGMLWAVHYGWRQEQIAESAQQIAEAGRELHSRLSRFAEPFAKLGQRLESTVGAYNEAVGSFDNRLMPQARRLEQSGAASGRELDAPEPVDVKARRVSSADGAEGLRRSLPPAA
ncbi:MAG TPA: DNA recombination protein RmuC [Solirubrobacteraceae bacterium]|nr:DNA recombination protein RmuC [Solirubrobacteraceae bacterium]